MIDGKHDLKVMTIQGLGSASLQSELSVGGTALGTGAVLARIKDNGLKVAIGTGIDVVALIGRLAGHDRPCGTVDA